MNDSSEIDANAVRVLANDWEVLLARMLLRVCDRVASTDEDQEWLDLYNALKPLAKKVLRSAHRPRRLPVTGVPSGRS